MQVATSRLRRNHQLTFSSKTSWLVCVLITELERLTPAVRLAFLRVCTIAGQLGRDPAGLPLLDGPKGGTVATGGRPRSLTSPKILAEYNLDVEHLDAFRTLGFGNVPPNKAALVALMKRIFPNDPSSARVATVKKALQRERARQRR